MFPTNLYSTDIIDVSDPTLPILLSSITSTHHPRDAKAKGEFLYITDNDLNLQIADIGNPANPSLVYNYPESSFSTKLAINGDYIYLSESAIMEVVNISNPFSPYRETIYPMTSGPVFASNDLILIAGYDHLEITTMAGDKISLDNRVFGYQLDISNYPNPFNTQTKISFRVPKASEVKLGIFDISGRKVTQLSPGYRQPGIYEIVWDAGDKPSGIYFYKLTTGNYTQTKKMVLLK
jgi:hypothetical protein